MCDLSDAPKIETVESVCSQIIEWQNTHGVSPETFAVPAPVHVALYLELEALAKWARPENPYVLSAHIDRPNVLIMGVPVVVDWAAR